jgi:formylglycine-generating enzyme required for sulfatase activity
MAQIQAIAPAPGNFGACGDNCPEMVIVAAGIFQHGSYNSEFGSANDEGPVDQVTIERKFAIAKYETTVAQYAAFVRETGYKPSKGCYADRQDGDGWEIRPDRSWRDPGFGQLPNEPVVCVSWYDAKAYIDWLSKKTGQAYRLPSETEWEYVARAGSKTAFYWGDDPDQSCHFANLRDFSFVDQKYRGSGAQCSDGFDHTAPIGSFAENKFGIFDISGNVSEWVEDCYARSYEVTDREAAETDCKTRGVRGGDWATGPTWSRSASRSKLEPDKRAFVLGFRVATSL